MPGMNCVEYLSRVTEIATKATAPNAKPRLPSHQRLSTPHPHKRCRIRKHGRHGNLRILCLPAEASAKEGAFSAREALAKVRRLNFTSHWPPSYLPKSSSSPRPFFPIK